MTPDQIAAVCHEANRAICEAQGDFSQPTWENAPEWQRASARLGVSMHLLGDHGPEASHNAWWANKRADGWIYGPVKDPEAKTHPCMVPFEQLPFEQQVKDHVFRAIVHALAVHLDTPDEPAAQANQAIAINEVPATAE